LTMLASHQPTDLQMLSTYGDRALAAWRAFSGQRALPESAAHGSVAERLAWGVKNFGHAGFEVLNGALDALTTGLPQPIGTIDLIASNPSGVPIQTYGVEGQALPPVLETTRFHYVQCNSGSFTRLKAVATEDRPALCFLLIGNVHYKSGIPVRVAFADAAGETQFHLGLGSDVMLLEPEFRFLKLNTNTERAIVVLADGESVELYCDGLLLARMPLKNTVAAWRSVTLAIEPKLAVFGDLMLYRSTTWTLTLDQLAVLRDRLREPSEGLVNALTQAGDAVALATLCRNDNTIRIAPHNAESSTALVEQTARLTRERRSYLAQMLSERLPAADGAAITATLSQELGPPIVDVKNLTVELERNPTLERRLYRRLQRKRETFEVVDSVNFEAHKGDVIAIIGHNGAGKSTLLRALCGLIPIRSGRIEIADRFLLLRPGMGMRDELSGRENIQSMGFYLGLTADQIAKLSDDIISFAELGSHIDKSVKYYSDGMRARLSFSIATAFAPEVVFLDELLGAGDVSFQEKAQVRLKTFIETAGTVIVVTHSMGFVADSCTKALLMHQGRQVHFGDPHEAIARYYMLLEQR
jgi:ABC-type polysaccharide/polyol phosphate transport system ATPase subunit